MITCPACGKENEDSAFECRRCRAPLREDAPPEEHAAEPEAAPSSESLGEVCRRCETYNEPGVRVCTNCGLQLFAEPEPEPAAEEAPPMDKTPPQAFAPEHVPDTPPAEPNPSITSEIRALAISDEEAAEAGLSPSNGAEEAPMDRTPPEPYAPQHIEQEPPPAPSRAKEVAAAAATAAGVAVGAAVGVVAGRRGAAAPEPPTMPPPPVAPPPAEKSCANCGAANPPAAKFCFDCGTPFAKKPAAPSPPEPPVRAAPPPPPPPPPPARVAPPPSIHVEPSIQVDAALAEEESIESTAESPAVRLDDIPPEEQAAGEPALAEEPLPEEFQPIPEDEPLAEQLPPAEEAVPAEAVAEPIEEEQPPPFQASLVVEKGASQGTNFPLAHLENRIGGPGADVELADDAYVAPHAATLFFAEDHLVVRDEGSANGVFVKVRESAALEPGDFFVAGERLFRYDGPTDLPSNGVGETPFLGAPRPQASAVRVSEILAGGRVGRTCHRSGPVISIGRTGCDMNFPADSLLAAKHAEIRIGDDGGASLFDLGAGPSGVFIRVKGQQDLQGGDVLLVGEELLRLEVG
jgi:ribosomal protein L40E